MDKLEKSPAVPAVDVTHSLGSEASHLASLMRRPVGGIAAALPTPAPPPTPPPTDDPMDPDSKMESLVKSYKELIHLAELRDDTEKVKGLKMQLSTLEVLMEKDQVQSGFR